MSREDEARYHHLLNGLKVLREAKAHGITDNLMEREREIRLATETVSDPKLRAELLKQCDDLLDD
jgi:hypothetical protein